MYKHKKRVKVFAIIKKANTYKINYGKHKILIKIEDNKFTSYFNDVKIREIHRKFSFTILLLEITKIVSTICGKNVDNQERIKNV